MSRRNRDDPHVIIRVSYVTDSENAEAAQEIIRTGLRRSLIQRLHEKSQKEKQGAV